jgi:excisionase family DNA binding protein
LKRKPSKESEEILSAYPEFMKPAQVQEALQISRATFFRWVEAGTMPGAVRIGGSWRVLREKLRQWLIDQTN